MTPQPNWDELVRELKKQISDGVYPPGSTLPSIKQLGCALGHSEHAVRQALQQLHKEALLTKTSRGRFVIPEQFVPRIYVWDPGSSGIQGGINATPVVLSKRLTNLPDHYLNLFETHGKEGHRASFVQKLHQVDSIPSYLEIILAPVDRLPGLLMKDHRRFSLLEIVNQSYQTEIDGVRQLVDVRPLTETEAKLLRSTVDFPALTVEQVYSCGSTVLACTIWIIPGGRYPLINQFQTPPDQR